MLFDRDCSLRTEEDYKKAERLFELCIRRLINLVFNINKWELLLCATAYQDAGTERKIKNISVIKFDLPITQEKFLHYLDIAWKVVCSIKTKDLLSNNAWQKDARAQSAALEIDYWY